MEDSQEALTPRRGNRQRKPSLKAVEYASLEPRIQKTVVVESASSETDPDENQVSEKPTILHDNELLSGDKLFTFHARKKCEAIINRSSQIREGNAPKTPHALRNRIKKDIAATIMEDHSSDGDFSDSGSEFAGSEVEDSDNTDDEVSESSDSDPPATKVPPKSVILAQKAKLIRGTERKYTIKADDYFANHASKKIVTSSHTLDKLETPRLPQDQLQKLLAKMELRKEHEAASTRLVDYCESNFFKWMYLLHENMSILLYGLGSKKAILNRFHAKCLKKLPTVVVNGFFPSLSIKDVLDSIIVTVLELKENPPNIYEACDLIERELSYISGCHLYLVVHNIDMIRNGKAQSVFARLACIKNLHLIVSIDHINAPLIWDHSKLSKFKFSWWDCTTFQPYIEETSFENSMMVQNTGSLALSSLRNVFLSLTSNSKGIYLVLVKYQIENGKKQYYQGLAFKDLYSLCREQFLVSSDLALRAQLTEFVDHKMVKFKRSSDGTEYLIIPIQNTLLQQFLNEQS